MANMSYCRFQNTLQDMRDCYEALQSGETLSWDEHSAMEMLVEICDRISGEFGMDHNVEVKHNAKIDDGSLPDDQFAAFCQFEDACEEGGYRPQEFTIAKEELQGMGYEGVELLYEALTKLAEKPSIKSYVENGTITNRHDLESVLHLPGKTFHVTKSL